MNVLLETLVWGLAGTISLSIIMGAAQGLHYTRINLPIILGTMVAGNLDHAIRAGYLMHFVMGWLQAYAYLVLFWATGEATWYIGGAFGVVHALFVLTVILPIIPSIHPRMSTEHRQPLPTSLLEPPGFLGLHYGGGTPFVTVVAHLCYGAILGAGISVTELSG